MFNYWIKKSRIIGEIHVGMVNPIVRRTSRTRHIENTIYQEPFNICRTPKDVVEKNGFERDVVQITPNIKHVYRTPWTVQKCSRCNAKIKTMGERVFDYEDEINQKWI